MRRALITLDYLLHIFHLGTIAFSLFGWIFKESRPANLALLIITLFSWFGLGRFFGVGYCFITDWQWKIKKRLGQGPIAGGYIKYLLDHITGKDVDSKKTNAMTMTLFFVILTSCVILTINDYWPVF